MLFLPPLGDAVSVGFQLGGLIVALIVVLIVVLSVVLIVVLIVVRIVVHFWVSPALIVGSLGGRVFGLQASLCLPGASCLGVALSGGVDGVASCRGDGNRWVG